MYIRRNERDNERDNSPFLYDNLYLGTKKKRIEGAPYFEFLDEVMDALTVVFPKALIQFEDFKTPYAEALLNRYRNKRRMFNDDIQGTGTMVLSGILSALRILGLPPAALQEQRIVCLGAGSAGLGVCTALLQGMLQTGKMKTETFKMFLYDYYNIY